MLFRRKDRGWTAGGEVHTKALTSAGAEPQEGPGQASSVSVSARGHLLSERTRRGCVCCLEGLGEPQSISAHFQTYFLDSLDLFWREKKGKGKHINTSVWRMFEVTYAVMAFLPVMSLCIVQEKEGDLKYLFFCKCKNVFDTNLITFVRFKWFGLQNMFPF